MVFQTRTDVPPQEKWPTAAIVGLVGVVLMVVIAGFGWWVKLKIVKRSTAATEMEDVEGGNRTTEPDNEDQGTATIGREDLKGPGTRNGASELDN